MKCECGNPATSKKIRACARCRHLDGSTKARERVIDLLRDETTTTAARAAIVLDISHDGAAKLLCRMVEAGRLRKRREELTTERDPGDALFGTWRDGAGRALAAGSYHDVYTLNG